MIYGDYWLRLSKLFYHYKKKSSSLPYLPIRLWIELTNICNFKCIMCPNKDLNKEDKGFMELDLFKNIIDEAQEFVFEINLAHRGESLLHPHLIEAISYAKKRQMYTRLHTNGSLLTEEKSRLIIGSGLDRLSFSFDGYDKETYENIRKGGNFERVLDNIINFLKIKKESLSKKPAAAIEVIDFGNKKEGDSTRAREEFRRKFDNLPLESFVIKGMHNWAGQIEKDREGKKYTVCPFPWNAMIIYWDGSVLPCTQDFFGTYVVGNAKDASLKEIWNSEKMVTLRKKLGGLRIRELEACSRCDRVWRQAFLGVPKEYLWKFLVKRMP